MQQISKIEEGKSGETQKKEKKYLTTMANLITKTCQSTHEKIKKWISPSPKPNQQNPKQNQQTPKPNKTNKPTKSQENNSKSEMTIWDWITEITGYMLVVLLTVGVALVILEIYTKHPQQGLALNNQPDTH